MSGSGKWDMSAREVNHLRDLIVYSFNTGRDVSSARLAQFQLEDRGYRVDVRTGAVFKEG